jgi:hypothetical protein
MEDTQEPQSRNLRQTKDRTKGQSLVEMALLTPILLLMMLGVLEVGWALRGYLVLSNANREATRFAARGRYLDFNQTTSETIGYPLVISHTYDSLAGTLPVDLSPSSENGAIIISHYVVDTGRPCEDMNTCICSQDPAGFKSDNAGNVADWDDEFHGPGPAWDDSDTWRYRSKPNEERPTRLDDAALKTQLVDENNVFNCQQYKKDDTLPWSINSVIAVEIFYDQPQLLHLFNTDSFLSRAIIPDPIPFYTQTTMRITADARSGGKSSDGVGCALWPIALSTETMAGWEPDDPPKDIYNGSGSGNFGWLHWPEDTRAGNEGYLINELYNPNLAATDFEDACESEKPSDGVLNAGDCVWGSTGISGSSDVKTALDYLITQPYIRIPVWDTAGATGSNGYYHIIGFALVRLTDYDLDNEKRISAQFVRWDNDACPGNGY